MSAALPPRPGLPPSPGSGLLALQAGVMAVVVLYFGRELLIPLALAVLLAFVLAPVVQLLRRPGLPNGLAVALSVALACGLLLALGVVLGRQLSSLAENLPSYQATVEQKLTRVRDMGGWLDRLTGALHQMNGAVPPAPEARTDLPRPMPVEVHNPEPGPLKLLQEIASPLLGPLATLAMVLILVVFILLYREDLRNRLLRLAGARDIHRTMAAMDDAAYRLSRYFLAQLGLNAGFGCVIATALWFIGVPNPLLWGVVAGLARFIPFVGAYLAAACPALLAVAVDPGWGMLVQVLALFLITEPILGQVIEPMVFGHSTGLSPIAVVAAATFWTWLWGPVGLLLSVPLTACLVVLGRHVEQLEFLDVALGDKPPLEPEELFYQRALAGDADALADQAEKCLKEKPLADYLDAVALPALRLAQQDLVRGSLAEERLARFRESLSELAEDLEEGAPAPAELPPLPWQAPGAVLCVGGRGPADGMAAALAARVLAAAGFGVQQGGLPAAPPRLVVLVLLEGGASAASARVLLRRQRRRLPGVPLLALAWQAQPEGGLVQALRNEEVTLAFSLPELVQETASQAGDPAPLVVPRPPPPAPGSEPEAAPDRGLLPRPA